jgi:polyribonucleotide nucleotidyltransferase
VLNPGRAAVAEGDLELVVAGTKDAVLMVESEAKGLSEEVMLGAVMFGHEKMQVAIDTINESAPEADEDLAAAVAAAATSGLSDAYQITDKQDRQAAVGVAKDAAVEALASGEDAKWSAEDVKGLAHMGLLFSRVVRPRPSSLRRWARAAMPRSLMPLKVSVKSRSCCITIFLRSAYFLRSA